MSLEATLHAWWSSATALKALLPASQVVTGTVQDDALSLPYATWNRESGSSPVRTSDGRTDQALMRLQIWHDDCDAGLAIKQAALAAFDNQEYSDAATAILVMRRQNDLNLQEEDGVWQFLIDFLVLYRDK